VTREPLGLRFKLIVTQAAQQKTTRATNELLLTR